MSLVSDIEAIVLAKIPGAKFVLSSYFKANVNSYNDVEHTVTTPLVILDNELSEQNEILQNATFNVETKIKLTFLTKDTVNDKNDRYINDNIITPLKISARGVYGAIYRLPSVRFGENETARFSVTPIFRRMNTVLTGVECEARWKVNEVVNICKDS